MRQQRLEMVTAVDRGVSVVDICAVYDVSRQTFYKWRDRYVEEGPEGLDDRSSKPRRPAGMIASRTEAKIVEMRKAHPRWGPRRLRTELHLLGTHEPLPARSTIGAVLVRNGLIDRDGQVAEEEQATIRFERERANELWQMDGVEIIVAGREVKIITCVDDHSRVCPSLHVAAAETAETAIAAFDRAAQAGYGLPYSVLSDRGGAFTGRTSGSVGQFERHLWQQGIATLNGRAYHPQTQGKIERFHRTLREWLADWQAAHGPLQDIESLERALELFRVDYNTRRPHQALNDDTPQQRFDTAVKAAPDAAATAHLRRRVTVRHTAANGNLAYADWTIGTGTAWANTTVVVTDYGSHIELHHPDGTLIRTLKPDYHRTYLPTGNPRGRPHKR